MKEVAKVYRFSSQDACSFVRKIDYHSLTATDLNPPKFDVTNNRMIELLREKEKERLFSSARHFLMKRKKAIDAGFSLLAKIIVSFASIEDVDDRNLKRVRTKSIEYCGVLGQLKSSGIEVQLEDNLEKLIAHIQQERARAKLVNLFVNQSYLRYGEEVEDVGSAGGDYLGEDIKMENMINAHDSGVDRECEVLSGGTEDGNKGEIKLADMVNYQRDRGFERVDEDWLGNTDDSKGDLNEEKNENEKEKVDPAAGNEKFSVDDEEEEHFVLYGMIRCS